MRTIARAFIVFPNMAVFGIGCDGGKTLNPSEPDGQLSAALASGSVLSAPSNVIAVATGSSSINIIWQDNSINESGFEVHRATAGGPFTLLFAGVLANTTYNDFAVQATTQYCYRVRAVRANGNKSLSSAFSNTACATTPAPPPPPLPPPAPVTATALDAIPYSSTDVSMTWSVPSFNGEEFRIERSLNGGQSWSVAGTSHAGNLAFWDSGLTSERQVCYRVIAFNSAGDAPPSNTDCTAPPAGPTNLTITPVDSQNVRLTWTDNSAVEDGYEVWGNLIFAYPCLPPGCDGGQYGPGWTLLAVLPPNSTALVTPSDCSPLVGGWPCSLSQVGVAVVATKDGGSSGGVPQ